VKLRFADFGEFDGIKKTDTVFLDNHSLIDKSKNAFFIDHHLATQTENRELLKKNAVVIGSEDDPGSNTMMIWQLYKAGELGNILVNCHDWDLVTHADADGYFSAYLFYRMIEGCTDESDVKIALTMGHLADIQQVTWDVEQLGAFIMGNTTVSGASDWQKNLRILKAYMKCLGAKNMSDQLVDGLESFADKVRHYAEVKNPLGYMNLADIYTYYFEYKKEIERFRYSIMQLPSITFLAPVNDKLYRTKVIIVSSPYDIGRSFLYEIMRKYNKGEATIWGIMNTGIDKLSCHAENYHAAYDFGKLLGGGGHRWGNDGVASAGSLGSAKITFDGLIDMINRVEV